MSNLSVKFEIYNSTQYGDTKGNRKWGGLSSQRSLKVTEIAPFDKAHANSISIP